MLGALRFPGVVAAMNLERPVEVTVLEVFVKQILLPAPRVGDIYELRAQGRERRWSRAIAQVLRTFTRTTFVVCSLIAVTRLHPLERCCEREEGNRR